MQDISVDVAGALPYLEEKVKSLVGRDSLSLDFRALIDKHLRMAVRDAASVQIIGMDRPVPISAIYQPIDLLQRDIRVSAVDLVAQRRNGVIFAGPGRGKTILTHHLFARYAQSPSCLPLLFTLRWPDTVDDLLKFVTYLQDGKVVDRTKRLLLLIDGYDEITMTERRALSRALKDFAALDLGTFLLTCRTFYDVHDVKAAHFTLAPFSRLDATRFLAAFSAAYGKEVDAAALLKELEQKGFDDFAAHPLMLAMVCILKTGPMRELPRSPIRLIQRAIDTLTFRWDEAKGVYRETGLGIEGDDRVKCLMAVAFAMQELTAPAALVEQEAQEFLSLMHRDDVRPDAFLREIAQWYGILVPASELHWTFVHRTIHDLLAARQWVESGTFKHWQVEQWTSRAAYAACLLRDATKAIVTALNRSEEVSVLAECLANYARFDPTEVGVAFLSYLRQYRKYQVSRAPGHVDVATPDDVFSLASDAFLTAMLQIGASSESGAKEVLIGYSLAELHRRGRRPADELIRTIRERYGGEVRFNVRRSQATVTVSTTEFRHTR